MSCHSCHIDGHSNFTRNDNLSDNSFGAPKLVISLLGRQGTAPFAWSGDVPDLATQIRNSIHKTMQSDIEQLDDSDVEALAAYIDSLPAPPSIDTLRGTANRAAIGRGQKLFAAHDCARCHAPPAYTSPQNEDVGLKDERGELRFNPPTLLGVGQRDVLLHDGRAKSLAEVFSQHRHPHGEEWSEDDVRDLVAFLRSL
jgi:mono/diheme cytochrome c family protein